MNCRLVPPSPKFWGPGALFQIAGAWLIESAGRGPRRVREKAHAQFSRAPDGPQVRRQRSGAEPYLLHVSWQLAPRIIVPDVELNVDVHDAGAQARGGRGCHATSRPRAPGPSAEPARLGRTSTAPPHGQASTGPRGAGHGARWWRLLRPVSQQLQVSS